MILKIGQKKIYFLEMNNNAEIPCEKYPIWKAKIIKFNKMKNKDFLDALFKSDWRGDGNQTFPYVA